MVETSHCGVSILWRLYTGVSTVRNHKTHCGVSTVCKYTYYFRTFKAYVHTLAELFLNVNKKIQVPLQHKK